MRRIVSCCIAVGALGAIMAPSAYATNNFSCRGSAARVQAPVTGLVEPVTANKPNDPCVAESNTLIPISIGSIVKAPTANAVTTNSASKATAMGSVVNAVINVGVVSLRADVLQANAAATCANGQPQLSGSSTIVNLRATAFGLPVNVPINPPPNTVLLNVAGVKVTLNEQMTANGETTVRAVHVTAPGLGTDVVAGEARADFHGSPCATTPPKPQCSDGVDNADPEDALADAADPGCHTDGNAGNPGSYDPNDNDETNTPKPQCSDGVDNADPEDALADAADPGCHTDGNAGNPGSYDPNDNDETNTPKPQCSDGIDNDGDGRTDFPNDPGCSGPDDNSETNPIAKTDCNDGIDNDGINGKDYPQDPGCTDAYDNSEGAHQGS